MSVELYAALRRKVGFEVVSQKEDVLTQLRILGRIHADNISRNSGNWKILMQRLNKAQTGRGWSIDISKYYFNRADNDLLVYAWRLIFQSKEGPLAPHLKEIIQIVATSPETSRTEVTEMTLGGASATRNMPVGGRRGAGIAGSVPVGPLAVHQKLMGG